MTGTNHIVQKPLAKAEEGQVSKFRLASLSLHTGSQILENFNNETMLSLAPSY